MFENLNFNELKESVYLKTFLVIGMVLFGLVIVNAFFNGFFGFILEPFTNPQAGLSKVIILFGTIVMGILLFINYFIFGSYTLLARIGVVDFVKPVSRVIPLSNAANLMVGYRRCQKQVIQINETNNTNFNLGGIAPTTAIFVNALQWIMLLVLFVTVPFGVYDLGGGSDDIVPFLVALLFVMIIKYVAICTCYLNLYMVTSQMYTNISLKSPTIIKWLFIVVLLITLLIAPILTLLGIPIPRIGAFNLILFFGSTIFLPVYTWFKIRGLFQYIYYNINQPDTPAAYNSYNGYNY